jgi:hypothetical protein
MSKQLLTANTSDILSKMQPINPASITIASNSDIKFPTEKAVIDYVDIKISTISAKTYFRLYRSSF